jgi:hypothetical protein
MPRRGPNITRSLFSNSSGLSESLTLTSSASYCLRTLRPDRPDFAPIFREPGHYERQPRPGTSNDRQRRRNRSRNPQLGGNPIPFLVCAAPPL